MLRRPRFWIPLLMLLALIWLLAPLFLPQPQDRVTVPYTFFKQQVAAGTVSEITSRGEDIQGLFKQPVADPNPPAAGANMPAGRPSQTYTKFATLKPAFDDRDLHRPGYWHAAPTRDLWYTKEHYFRNLSTSLHSRATRSTRSPSA
jgi:hypothetical protein